MIISAKKISLSQSNFIKNSSYFARGSYCIYINDSKGKAIENIVDNLAIKSLFIYDNLDNKQIIIIYPNELNNSIVFNIEDKFSWSKFNSVLKTILIKKNFKYIHTLESSKILEKIEVSQKLIASKEFLKATKKSKELSSKKTYIIKDIIVNALLIAIFFMQNYYFDKMRAENNDGFYQAKELVQNEIRNITKKTNKIKQLIKTTPSDVAFSYDDIINYRGIK